MILTCSYIAVRIVIPVTTICTKTFVRNFEQIKWWDGSQQRNSILVVVFHPWKLAYAQFHISMDQAYGCWPGGVLSSRLWIGFV